MKIIAIVMLLAVLPSWVCAQDQKADQDRALRGIEAFTAMQARTDPHYLVVEDALLKEIDAIIAQSPPAGWLPTIRRRYVALSDAEHAKERDAIRQSETDISSRLGSGDAGWHTRLAQLEEELKAGALGPRLHALRALEAAKLYYPGNNVFIAWRASKVPIATEYELGAISRTEYEDRWNKSTAYFMDRQSADGGVRANMAAEEYRLGMEMLRQTAPQRSMKCRTTTAYGVTETRCF